MTENSLTEVRIATVEAGMSQALETRSLAQPQGGCGDSESHRSMFLACAPAWLNENVLAPTLSGKVKHCKHFRKCPQDDGAFLSGGAAEVGNARCCQYLQKHAHPPGQGRRQVFHQVLSRLCFPPTLCRRSSQRLFVDGCDEENGGAG